MDGWENYIDNDTQDVDLKNVSWEDLDDTQQESNIPKPLKSLQPFYQPVGVETGRSDLGAVLRSTIAGSGRDINQIPLSFINQFLMNAPRSAQETFMGVKFPTEKEVVSPTARTLSYGAGILGGFKNPLLNAISKGTLGQQVLKGAATGFAYSPEDFTDVGARTVQAIGGATIPPVARLAGKSIKAIGNISKTGRDYLYNIAQPTIQKITNNIRNNPIIGKTLGLKDETIGVLNKYGYEIASNPDALKESADAAFDLATNKGTTVYGDKINVRNTLSKLKSIYKDLKGAERYKIEKIMKRLKPLQPAPEGFYKTKLPTPTQLTRQFRGEKLTDIAEEVRISKEAFSAIRQDINNLRGSGYDNKVLELVDSLYDDAERSGLTGIQDARKLFSDWKQVSKVSRDLSKIEKMDITKLHSDLSTVATNPKKYSLMVDKYTPYLGKEDAIKVFNEAMDVHSGERAKKVLPFVGLGTTGAVGTSIGLNIIRKMMNKKR